MSTFPRIIVDNATTKVSVNIDGKWVDVGTLGSLITDYADDDPVYRYHRIPSTRNEYTMSVKYDASYFMWGWGVSAADVQAARDCLEPVLGRPLTDAWAAYAGRCLARLRLPVWPQGDVPSWGRWQERFRGWPWRSIVLPDPVEALRASLPPVRLEVETPPPWWVPVGAIGGVPVVTWPRD